MTLSEVVTENLSRLRDLRGLTQAEVAKRGKISISYVSMLERGEREGTLTTFEVLAKVFKVPVISLFTRAKPDALKSTKAKKPVVKAKKPAAKSATKKPKVVSKKPVLKSIKKEETKEKTVAA